MAIMPNDIRVNNIVHILKDGNFIFMVLHTCLANIILSHLIALMKNLTSFNLFAFSPHQKNRGLISACRKLIYWW